MRVKLLVGYPFAEHVITNRITPVLKELKKRGHSCVLLDYRSNQSADIEDDVQRETFYSFPYKTSSSLRRLFYECLNLLSFGLKNITINSRGEAGGALFVSIPSMLFVFARVICPNKQVTILDVRDLTWEYLLENKNNPATRVWRRLVLWAAKGYDYILCSNQFEIDYFSAQGLTKRKLILYSNGIEKRKFDLVCKVKKTDGPEFNVLYVGNIGLAQNLAQLVDVVKDLPATTLTIIGDGLQKSALENKVAKEDIGNVRLTGVKNWQGVLNDYAATDVLFLSLGRNYPSAVPSKVYEYLSVGCPIVFLGPAGACSSLLERFKLVHFIDIGEHDWELSLRRLLVSLRVSDRSVDDEAHASENRLLIESAFIRENAAFRSISLIQELSGNETGNMLK